MGHYCASMKPWARLVPCAPYKSAINEVDGNIRKAGHTLGRGCLMVYGRIALPCVRTIDSRGSLIPTRRMHITVSSFPAQSDARQGQDGRRVAHDGRVGVAQTVWLTRVSGDTQIADSRYEKQTTAVACCEHMQSWIPVIAAEILASLRESLPTLETLLHLELR